MEYLKERERALWREKAIDEIKVLKNNGMTNIDCVLCGVCGCEEDRQHRVFASVAESSDMFRRSCGDEDEEETHHDTLDSRCVCVEVTHPLDDTLLADGFRDECVSLFCCECDVTTE